MIIWRFAVKQRMYRNSLAQQLIVAMILSVTFCLTVQGQSWTQYDQGTPPQHAVGVSPLGSYLSADLGAINLSNGSLNIKLPMGAVGGRSFGIPITLNFGSKVWSTGHDTFFNPNPPWNREVDMVYARYAVADNKADLFNRVAPGWTIGGTPFIRKKFIGISNCIQGWYVHNLTRLTVVLPDKGEIELRDDQTDGAPLNANCVSTYVEYRGSRWHATDGSGAIFISDVDNGVVSGNMAGTLIAADGMRYRFENTTGGLTDALARCVSITDRNGNRISINYYVDPGNPNHITTDYIDQLGRTVKVEQNVADPADSSVILALLVTITGYQNSTQYYKVKTDLLGNHIRSDFNYNGLPIVAGQNDSFGACYGGDQPPPANVLFTGSYCAVQERIDNRKQVTEVILPDGRSLHFKYNLYGEVAEALLPTGGKLQYDYGASFGIPAGNSLAFEVQGQLNLISNIDRVVRERRTYPDGSTLEGSWTYAYAPQTVGGVSHACAEVKGYAGSSSGGTLLQRQRHFFLQASRYLTGRGGFGTGYSLWSTGIEWRTETLDSAGNVINAIEQDWTQRTPVFWTIGYTQEQPGNDNRVSQTRKYLETGSFDKTEIGYDFDPQRDRANNVVDVKEYDFGQTTPARQTITKYLKFNPDNANIDYTSDAVHSISLPIKQSIYKGASEMARTVYQYDKYTNDGNNATLTDYGPSVTGHDTAYGPGMTTRGNVTAVGRWLDANASTLFTYSRYDTLGNVISTKDPRGNVTTISYVDNFGGGDNPESGAGGASGPTFALPTLITSPPPNPGEEQHTAKSQYDFSTGLLTGFKDRNGVITKTEYNDTFNRPTKIINAKGIADVEAQTAMYYAPQSTPYGVMLANNDVLTAKDRDATGDGILRSWTVTDGFGRTIESWTRHPQGDVKVTAIYDGLGRASQASNPYRNGETPVYTTTTYDLAGRVTAVTTPDGATVSTAYSGAQTTVTDQAGKKRRSITDALGRLVSVTEDQGGLGYVTAYLYDALGNLRQVTQGAQTRWFAYDSLSRLILVKNPEQDTIANHNYTDPVTGHSDNWSLVYSYDENGNLKERRDARGVVTNYTYDALNRNTKIDHKINGSVTRSVESIYDGAANGKGRLYFERTKENGVDSTKTVIGSYDALGRPLNKQQSFWRGSDWGTPFVIQHSHDLAGAVKTLTYPSGRMVNYSYDQTGRLNSFTGNLGDGVNRNYATGIQYDAAGMMKREQFGTTIPLYHRRHYNNRLQLFDIRLGTDPNPSYDSDDLNTWQNAAGSWNRGALRLYYSTIDVCHVYGNGGTNNNGNLLRMDHHIPADDAVSSFVASIDKYDYDPLNRLKSVTELSYTKGTSGEDIYQGVFRQAFLYDRWGNRTIDQAKTTGGVNNKAYTVSAESNRLATVDGLTISYDAVGNQINDGSGARKYDGDNRMVEAKNSAGVTVSWYVYDAAGRRVVRAVGSQVTWQIYGFGGELLAEYAFGNAPSVPQKEYGYRGGQLLVVWDASETGDRQLQWLVQDHLGSTRMVVDRSGSLGGVRRHDFLPFGEELFAGTGIRTAALGYGADSTRQKFTGKERDGETGLDYFLARYYSSIQGRFTSVNPENAGAIEDDPQSWNGYAYARNAPAVYSDPDGRRYRICSTDGECYNHSDDDFNAGRRAGTKDGFTFTGDGKYYETGEIRDKDGNLIATYEQTSLDDRAHQLAFEMQRNFGSPDLYKRVAANLVGGAAMAAILGWRGGALPAPRPFKSINLPAWRTIKIDIDHIASGHMSGGSRVSSLKTLFPSHMTKGQIEKVVREAYRHGEKISAQGEKVLVRGEAGGLKIEMWVNRTTKTIETAYPIF